MPEPYETPNSGLIAVLFCAIVGLIVYAGLMH